MQMVLLFSSNSQPRLHLLQSITIISLSRGGPEDSKTPATGKVGIILSQVMALPKKQCFETIEDLLASSGPPLDDKIIVIDAALAENWTKTRVSYLTYPCQL